MKARIAVVIVMLGVLAIGIGAMPGCSVFVGSDTPSSQVLQDVRAAETLYLTAITIVNVKSGGKVSPEVREAEAIIFDFLAAAKEAAKAGDVVTVNQKLDLFNDTLRKFNERYVNNQPPASQPSI